MKKFILIPLILILFAMSGEKIEEELPPNNSTLYLDATRVFQGVDKHFIVLSTKTSENTNLSRIRRYEGYLREYNGWNADLMLKILIAESEGNPKVINHHDRHRTCNKSYGLMQLSCEHLTDYDIWDSWDDPEENIRVAYEVWKRQGYEAWGAYTDGRYLTVK
jgi:hypothetical protein